MVTDAPSAPAPTHWFTLDWIERIVEVDTFAPPPDEGEPQPLRERHLHYARRVGATSWSSAEHLRRWHLEHDSWIPDGALREWGYEPNVSEIYNRMNGRTP